MGRSQSRTHNFTIIDGLKLKMAVIEHGVTLNDASNEIGYCRDYLTKAVLNGRISQRALIGLKAKFNIDGAELIPDEKPQEAEEQTQQAQQTMFDNPPAEITFDWDAFYRAVKSAVVDAIKEVL